MTGLHRAIQRVGNGRKADRPRQARSKANADASWVSASEARVQTHTGPRLCPPRTSRSTMGTGEGRGIVPLRGANARAQRLVLRTQSRSVRLWSAAVSSEDQPQRAKPSHARNKLPGIIDLPTRCGGCLEFNPAPEPRLPPPPGCQFRTRNQARPRARISRPRAANPGVVAMIPARVRINPTNTAPK